MSAARDTLIAARALIERPENWTRGAASRTARGRRVPVDDPQARRFCATGAVWLVVQREGSGSGFYDALGLLCAAAGVNDLVKLFAVHDAGDHAAALALFDRAIADADNQENADV